MPGRAAKKAKPDENVQRKARHLLREFVILSEAKDLLFGGKQREARFVSGRAFRRAVARALPKRLQALSTRPEGDKGVLERNPLRKHLND
jgi:hypothetical protein